MRRNLIWGLGIGLTVLLFLAFLIPLLVVVNLDKSNTSDKDKDLNWKPTNGNMAIPVGGTSRGRSGAGGVASLDISEDGTRFVETMFYTEHSPTQEDSMKNTTVWQLVDNGSGISEYEPVGQLLPGIWSTDDMEDSLSGSSSLLQATSISGDGSTVAIGSPHGDQYSRSYSYGYVQVYRLDDTTNDQTWKSVGPPLLEARDFVPWSHVASAHFGQSTSLSQDGRRMAVGVTHVNRQDVTISGPPDWIVTEGDPLPTISYVQVLEYHYFLEGSNSVHQDKLNDVTSPLPETIATWNPIGDILDGSCLDDEQTTGCRPCGTTADGEPSFGHAVSMNAMGTRVAAGAPQSAKECSNSNATGFVRVFDLSTSSSTTPPQWNQLGDDIVVPELDPFYDKYLVHREFGRSVSLAGNGQRVAIGSNAGAVVLEWNLEREQWIRIGRILTWSNSTARHNRYTTVSLSSDGSHVAVGGPYGGGNQAVVTVYQWNAVENDWDVEGSPTYYNDHYFGRLVGLSGDENKLCVANDWWSWVLEAPSTDADVDLDSTTTVLRGNDTAAPTISPATTTTFGKDPASTASTEYIIYSGQEDGETFAELQNDMGCSEATPCGKCNGDCDSDLDCQDGLQCYLRPGMDTSIVPGCIGRGDPGTDYCFQLPEDRTTLMLRETTCSESNRCGRCEGDCDSDKECSNGLVCRQRNGNTKVPGCKGTGIPGLDYCAVPPLLLHYFP